MFVSGISFNVRGTTFKNEDGIDIQKGIKQVLKEYKENGYITKEDLYNGYSNTDIKEMDLNVSEYEDIEFGGRIKKDTYKGEICYKVYISKIYGIDENSFVSMNFNDIDDNYFHIGYVPKEDLEELNKILEDENAKKYRVSIKITGGKYKHSRYDTYEDKEKIEINELTYGFETTVYTDDGNKSEEKTISDIKNTEEIGTEKVKIGNEFNGEIKNNKKGNIFYNILIILSQTGTVIVSLIAMLPSLIALGVIIWILSLLF